jgi:hypothetical protein
MGEMEEKLKISLGTMEGEYRNASVVAYPAGLAKRVGVSDIEALIVLGFKGKHYTDPDDATNAALKALDSLGIGPDDVEFVYKKLDFEKK